MLAVDLSNLLASSFHVKSACMCFCTELSLQFTKNALCCPFSSLAPSVGAFTTGSFLPLAHHPARCGRGWRFGRWSPFSCALLPLCPHMFSSNLVDQFVVLFVPSFSQMSPPNGNDHPLPFDLFILPFLPVSLILFRRCDDV